MTWKLNRIKYPDIPSTHAQGVALAALFVWMLIIFGVYSEYLLAVIYAPYT